MSQQIFPALEDDRLSATMLKIAAEWAAEAWPLEPHEPAGAGTIGERISFMAEVLQSLQDAMPGPKGGHLF